MDQRSERNSPVKICLMIKKDLMDYQILTFLLKTTLNNITKTPHNEKNRINSCANSCTKKEKLQNIQKILENQIFILNHCCLSNNTKMTSFIHDKFYTESC